MAIKDLDTSENKDRNSKTDEAQQDSQNATGNILEEGKTASTVEVKNAHATGDGSYGRNDESLPDEDAEVKKGENNY
jgi:hypothetical protein